VKQPVRLDGFTLIEILVAMMITMIVMASVFALFGGSQKSFERENEVADMQMSTRSGVERLSRDLTMAGYRTPPAAAVLWNDGGGINPDEITIVHADPNVPTSRPLQCGGAGRGGGRGPCGTIGQSATLFLDPLTFDPAPPSLEDAYASGMVLAAIETEDCNGDGQVGFVPFVVTNPPTLTSAGGSPTLNVNHNPGSAGGDINPPGGFNGEIREDCAIVGRFRIIQYRVSEEPPAGNPTLERRDLSDGNVWRSVALNIENLQFRYGVGTVAAVVDVPAVPTDDPTTWINRVDLTLTGRTDRKNLQGSSPGVFDIDDTYIRKSISSTVSLRNVASAAANRALDDLAEETPP